MDGHDRSSRQPSLSHPSFDQGNTASNGRTRTSAGGVAFDFSTDGDEKFEIMSAQLPDQKTPAAHLSWLFLEQMRSRAGTKGRVSRKRLQQQVRFHPAPSKMCRFPWTRVRFETWRRNRNPAEARLFSSKADEVLASPFDELEGRWRSSQKVVRTP